MTEASRKPKRWLRFSLRSFLIAVTLFGVVVGPYIYRAEKQRAAVKWVRANGGTVWYDTQIYGFGGYSEPVPKPLHGILEIDYYSSVVSVNLNATHVNELKPLSCFKMLSELDLTGTQVTDLKPLKNLTNLKLLMLDSNQVSEEAIETLQQALPHCEIRY